MYSDDVEQTERLVDAEEEYNKGEKQEAKCQDPFFAFLFHAHLITMIVLAFLWGVPAYEKTYDESASNPIDYKAVFYVCAITALASLFISMATLGVMMLCVTFIIKIALLWTVAVSGAVMVWCAIYGNIMGAVFSGLAFLCGICYARAVWSRIPFAAENLKTGFAAVKTNLGIVFYSFLIASTNIVYVLFWSLVVIGINDKNGGAPNAGFIFLLFVALFWTQQVVYNVIHTSIAGLVGSWWFDPTSADSCCSPATHSAVWRASTYSFGSVAFGSLLVAVIQAVRQLVYAMKEQGDNACLVCLLECLLGCIEGTLRYFNKWAFIYTGLYGYSYLESGKRVMQLFEARGFTTVIADDLVSNAITLCSLVIGLLTGATALSVKAANPDWFKGYDAYGNPDAMAFFLGFFIGLLMANITLGVVDSAVETVIVCWAEAPADLETNHPEQFSKMKETWEEHYPECCPVSE